MRLHLNVDADDIALVLAARLGVEPDAVEVDVDRIEVAVELPEPYLDAFGDERAVPDDDLVVAVPFVLGEVVR